jgi:hypothetical protein
MEGQYQARKERREDKILLSNPNRLKFSRKVII